jgi:hypothetical protein
VHLHWWPFLLCLHRQKQRPLPFYEQLLFWDDAKAEVAPFLISVSRRNTLGETMERKEKAIVSVVFLVLAILIVLACALFDAGNINHWLP